MSIDPSVIAALQSALKSDPNNLAVRLHLGGLLLDSGQPTEALEQFAAVLAFQPDNLEALGKAATAADASGDPIRAQGYRRLHEALSWNSARGLVESVPEPLEKQTINDVPDRVPLKEAAFEDDDGTSNDFMIEISDLTLKDVAGMIHVKKRLNSAFLAPMRNQDMMKLYGKSLKGGLLLYGPPGCGKTYIARALAGELGARFLCVGITDIIDMYIGESEKNLARIFDSARRNAPCVLFLDELDALGRKRSLMRESAGRGIINQLLDEMDGAKQDNEGVFVLAATNHPWDVDSALRRPGRLDRTVLVLPPDEDARKELFRMNLKGRPVESVDLDWLAGKTEDFSGADIMHLCDSAAEKAMEESIESGITRPIRMNDFKSALKEVRSSIRSWFETARNHAIYANESGMYDDLVEYLKSRKML